MRYTCSLTALSLILLTGCASGAVKDTLGLSRAAPDEFRVVSRPPLSVPPQFNLQPPGTATAGPGQEPSSEQAKSLVLGTNGAKPTGKTAPLPAVSSAESSFLRNAGADQANPNVRDEMVEEKMVRQQQKEEGSWWDALSILPAKKEPLVQPKAEAERIKKNEEEGKPVNEGDTPETKDKDNGVLGNLLGY